MGPFRALTPGRRSENARKTSMPPLFILALGALGTAALAKVLARESRRVNAELDAQRRAEKAGTLDPRATLRRDPATGEYRPIDS